MSHELKGRIEVYADDLDKIGWAFCVDPSEAAKDLRDLLAELSRLQEESERLKSIARRINMSAVLIPGLNGEAAVSGALIAELATALASQEQGGSDHE